MIDLRSDTVTRPCTNMRAAMAAAEVGDDVFGEDPTVNRLEKIAAERLGKEAAVFVSSGTQANLLAMLSHCQRGDEYIAGQAAHTYRFEGGGAAIVGGTQPQPIPFADDGTLPCVDIEAAVKPDDQHFARTRLVCIENTQDGRALPIQYLQDVSAICEQRDLKLHMDGARLFNAAIELDVAVDELARGCDSVSVCLSKGLGAPVGSVLASDAETVASARRQRKMLGGGMRQAGILAAAGIHALEHNVERLAEDHQRASELASALRQRVQGAVQQNTNMIFLDLEPEELRALLSHMAEHGVRVQRPRWVLHKDVTTEDFGQVLAAVNAFAGV